jgi:anaerobic selenocysteine-containing dehydrogenase
VTGKWKHPGGGAFWSNRGDGIYHWNKTLIEGLDHVDKSIRRMDMSRIGAVLTGDRTELGDGPQVHAMIIQNTNPAVVAPDSNRVRRGFLRDDLFTVVHEQFMTETAKLADIVLPATMFLEHDDLYHAGGHTHIQIGPKLIEPPGECRSNHEVLQALATRLGAKHAGFEMTALELADATLKASNWPGAAEVLENKWIDAADTFERSHYLDGFGHPDQKFRFAPDWKALGPQGHKMPELPDYWAATDQATSAHPFRLVAAPARNFLNTSFTETPSSRKREGRPVALVHETDAASLGIEDGGRIVLGNNQGEVILEAKLVTTQQPGTIVVESIWPNADFAHGMGINALTSDEPAAPNGGAVFHDTAVWMRALAAEGAGELLAAE